MDPFFHTGLSISDSLKTVRKSVLIYETIIQGFLFFKDTTSKQRKIPAFSWFLFSFLQSYAILLLNAIADFLTVSRGKVRLSLMGTR